MGQHFADVVDVVQWFFVEIKNWCSVFFGFDQTFEQFGELHIAIVAWARSENMSTNKSTDQGKVANDIQKFVARRFILELQFHRVQCSDASC